jgi:hypothetical protein
MNFPIDERAKKRSAKIRNLYDIVIATAPFGYCAYILYQAIQAYRRAKSHEIFMTPYEKHLAAVILILFLSLWICWIGVVLMARHGRKKSNSKLSGSIEVGWGYVKVGTIYIPTKDVHSIRKTPFSINFRYTMDGAEYFIHFPRRWLRREDVDQVVSALKEAIA